MDEFFKRVKDLMFKNKLQSFLFVMAMLVLISIIINICMGRDIKDYSLSVRVDIIIFIMYFFSLKK